MLDSGFFVDRPLVKNRITSAVLLRFSLQASIPWDDEPDIERVITIVREMLGEE